MNTTGSIGEARFIAESLAYGHMPCIPFSACAYDILLVTSNKMYKVQIKTSKKPSKHVKRDRYCFNLSNGTKKKPYTRYDIDLIALYCIDQNDFYFLFRDQFEGKSRYNVYTDENTNYLFKNRFDLL